MSIFRAEHARVWKVSRLLTCTLYARQVNIERYSGCLRGCTKYLFTKIAKQDKNTDRMECFELSGLS